MPKQTPRATRGFYRRDPIHLARSLLGQRLVRVIDGRRAAGVIVETEAYLGIPDLAAHTCNGRRTPRNESMWHDGGTSYVYFTYGMHHCMNIVARGVDQPVAVLLRALEPTEGLALMRARRKMEKPTALCSGPAKLCQALAIDRTLDGEDLVNSDTLFVEMLRARALPQSRICVGPRIGVDYAGPWADKPLRFWIKTSEHVSRRAIRGK